MAAGYGTDVQAIINKFVAQRDQARGEKHSKVKNYLTYEPGTIQYDAFSPSYSSDSLFSESFENDSAAEDEIVYKRSTTTKAIFTWSLTETLKVQAKASVQVGLPSIADGKVELTTEVDFSSTQTHTQETDQSWEIDTTIKVPARSTVIASVAIASADYSPPFTIPIVVTGNLNITYPETRNSPEISETWFPQDIFAGQTGFSPLSAGNAQFLVRGQFTGRQGLHVDVVVSPPTRLSAARPGTVVEHAGAIQDTTAAPPVEAMPMAG